MNSIFPTSMLERLERYRVVAGFSIDDVNNAVPVAEALLAGGIEAIELTLRTPVAVEAVRAIHDQVPEMLVGVGTILTPEMVREVQAAGADFGVAPGLSAEVVLEAQRVGLPFAPGIATPTDIEAALKLGCRLLKLFPAETLGGISYLRSISAPYDHLGVRYFPLGGVNTENMLRYLGEPNIPAVGGSWIVDKKSVAEGDWSSVTAKAAEVRTILSGNPSSEEVRSDAASKAVAS